jgi:glycosyltransferase involved in cell wall biosynthesis
MKIIHVLENIDIKYGGLPMAVLMLVKYLDKLNIENVIITIKESNNEYHPLIEQYNYNIKKAKLFGPKKVKYSIELKRVLEREITKDTVIHIHSIWTYLSYLSYKKAFKYNIPFIVSTRGMLYEWCLKQSKFVKSIALNFFVKDMLNRANGIHITEVNEASALKQLGITNKNIFCVPDGIEIKHKYDNFDNNILNTIEYNKNKRYIMFLGRIVKNKGLHYLINSYKKLKNKYQNIEVLVVGGIEDKNYFNSLEKVDGVKFLGQLDGLQKHTIFSISDLFVLPTYTENFGIAIAEAMSYKLPVITTTGTPWREIKEKDAGWWIELNQKNLDRALEEALNCDKECLKSKGENGYNIIKNYTWDKQAIKMKEVYKKILKGYK